MRDVLEHLRANVGEGTHTWFRHTLSHAQLAPWTSHPWEKFIAAERAAEALYTDPDYVSRVLEYYSKALDRSTHLMAKCVVAHASFDVLSQTIHKGS